MTFFYGARWHNPSPSNRFPLARQTMFGLGAAPSSDTYWGQQAGAHNFTPEQQAIAAEIDFFLQSSDAAITGILSDNTIASQLTVAASEFLDEWGKQGRKAYGGILNINPTAVGQEGEQSGYQVIWGMYDKLGEKLEKLDTPDEALLNTIHAKIMASYPTKPLRSANIFGLFDNFGDLTNAYYDVYSEEQKGKPRLPTRSFGWRKYLIWGGLALVGVGAVAWIAKRNKRR